MSESEMTVEVNPLKLSLAEVIALNKAQNKATDEEKNECMSLKSYISRKSFRPNGFKPKKLYNQSNGVNLFTHKAYKINNRLRNIPGFGSKPIHQRLGYFRVIKNRRNFSLSQEMARQISFRARFNHWVKSQPNNDFRNPTMTFKNPNALTSSFVSPLTRNSVSKFNRLNGNSYAGTHNGSISSFTSNIVRHSINRCLNPLIQKEMQELRSGLTVIDEDIFEQFRPTVEGTAYTTNDRFSTYF